MPEPDRLGRYRVIRLLGSGAFATVWLAHDDALDAPVAVKVLAENWSHRLDVHERFLQEAQILRRCDSDRVVQVYDLGDLDDGRPYFVMAYADRGTLADRLTQGPLDVPTALAYATQAALGVAALHDIGVIHRDVKPSNVLLRTARGGAERVLVADLGMAKAVARATGFTLTVGTPGYMAPEQITGEGLSVRADVYGLGVLLHELLTGQVPVDGDVAGGGVPGEVAAVLGRALAADPGQRYADAGAFAAALAAGGPPEPTRTSAAAPPEALPARAAPFNHPGAPAEAPPETAPVPAPAATSPVAPVELTPETPATPAGTPLAAPQRRRRRRAVAAALVPVAAAAAVGGVLLSRRQPVTLRDTTETVTVTVPAAWVGQLQDAGWNLDRFGRPGRAPALAVAPDLTRWRDAASATPGLFVGVAPDVPASAVWATVVHPSCGSPVSREVTSGALTGQARRITGCAGSSVVWDEVVLAPPGAAYTVYVQVKAADVAELERTADILAHLRVTDPAQAGSSGS